MTSRLEKARKEEAEARRDGRHASTAAAAKPTPEAPAWPAPPKPAAYHGLAGDLVHTIEPHSEADPVALLVQVLVGFGNALGRGAHFCVEGDVHQTNEYVVLVGRTSKGRKGSSWGQIRRPLEAADPDWARDRIQSGLSSGEGVIWSVRDPIMGRQPVKERGRITGYQEVESDSGVQDKRLMVYEPEFANVLKQTERKGNSLSTTLRQAWETGSLQTLTKNSPARASDAHISIIAHITLEELQRCLSCTEAANGFANRFMWACVRRSKELPEGGRIDGRVMGGLQTRLAQALQFGRQVGEITRDEAARAIWRKVYGPLSAGQPGLSGALLARSESHAMRLSCLYALLDRSRQVRQEHLLAALALWDFFQGSVQFIFGDRLGDPIADELLRLLRAARDQGLTRSELVDALGRHCSGDRLSRSLGLLLEYQLARCERVSTGGRPAEWWFACRW